MKRLKTLPYKDYYIEINGEFDWNEVDGCDCVKLTTYIFKGFEIIHSFQDMLNSKKPFKFLFWKVSKPKSLKQLTEEEIEDNVHFCKKYIDRLIYKNEMTHGLLDSLEEL